MTPSMRHGNDDLWMRSALREARKGVGHTSPNPAVGALLVDRGRILSRGHHRGAGQPHAEIECLRRWKKSVPASATLFVTLEPCSTVGRTGACTEAIIRSGVKNVVIGTIDMNPNHAARGVAFLEDAGIRVRTGVLAEECSQLNEHFNKWITTGMPFVIAKCGMTIDGRLTRRPKDPRWITSAASRQHAQRLRAQVDAILVGAETIRRDNPRLTVRGVTRARQPLRVVMTQSGKLPRDANVFRDRFKNRTVIYKNKSLRSVLADLGRQEVTSVLIEGGGQLLGHALDEGLIDKIQVYVAPLLTGGPVIAFGANGAASTATSEYVDQITFAKIGPDVCVTGYPRFGQAAA